MVILRAVPVPGVTEIVVNPTGSVFTDASCANTQCGKAAETIDSERIERRREFIPVQSYNVI
jgi:hypothetical protein